MDKESTSKQEVPQQPRQKDFPILAPKDYMICYEAGHTACLPFSPSKGQFFLQLFYSCFFLLYWEWEGTQVQITCHPSSWSPAPEDTHLMESAKHLREILDFEIYIVTGWDTGLPPVGKGKYVLWMRGRVKRYLMTRRVDCARDQLLFTKPVSFSSQKQSEITFPSPLAGVYGHVTRFQPMKCEQT